MASLDPRSIHVFSSVPAVATADPSFHDLMAEQLRRAPWLGVSIALHAVTFLLLWMVPSAPRIAAARTAMVVPAEQPPEQPDDVPPEIPPIVETPPVAPTLVPVDVAETPVERNDSFDVFDAPRDAESAFDSLRRNPAVGLGGGAAGPGKFRRRAGGRTATGKPTQAAIRGALEWLRSHQDEDGKWDADEFMKHDADGAACDGPGNPTHDVGVTGLALLAFLGDGSTLRSGPYRDVVKRGVSWLLDQQDPNTGLFGTTSSNEFVYDHAIAALAMVEAYGLSDYRVLRESAQRGIDYLEYHRNPYSVWRYQPRDGTDDTSVTGWCVMAYKSAQDFGLPVNTTALKLSAAWFDRITDPVTGRSGYTDRGGHSSRRAGDHAVRFPRERNEAMTAVTLLCRFFLGQDPSEDPTLRRQAELLLATPPVWNTADGSIDHYAWYYATYALYQFGGGPWKVWERHLTKAVVEPQRKDGCFDGSWDPVGVWGEDGGRVYSTALLCLTLEAYYRYTRLVR